MEMLKLFFAGIVVGIANVIPGVSGGTMAVILGVYDHLISIISFNIKKIFADWKFWLPLGIGMAAGILLFSKFVNFLFERYPVYTCFFFAGLIVGSLPMIYKRCVNAEQNQKLPSVGVCVCIIAAFALMIFLALFNQESLSEGAAYTELTLSLGIKLLAGGALAAIAMIIPGISGSFLMLVLGIYATIIAAVADLNIMIMLPVAVGVVIGLFSGAGLVRVLMAKIPFHTYGVILGLIAGSILAVIPAKECAALIGSGSSPILLVVLVSLVCFAAGFMLAFCQKPETAQSAE
ncbi:MAG: DUF368 domain-containing protein [Spirochaetaceae bacterium]|nr:DUF368 domain-containing protein [Spirochaetaceae bacterium]